MMKFKMTYHAQVERIDRLVACVQHIGVGEVIKEMPGRNGRTELLTDTGLLLVVHSATNTLITGYAVTPRQLGGIYQDQHIPQYLRKKVQTNSKKFAFLFTMQEIGG